METRLLQRRKASESVFLQWEAEWVKQTLFHMILDVAWMSFVMCSSVVISIPCTSHLRGSLWVFAWMGWSSNLTTHTLLTNCLYCFVRYCVCQNPTRDELILFFSLLCTFTHTIQSLSLVAIFILAFSLNAETDAWQTTSCMCGRRSESLVYSWSTSYTALNDKSLILCYTVRFAQWANIL